MKGQPEEVILLQLPDGGDVGFIQRLFDIDKSLGEKRFRVRGNGFEVGDEGALRVYRGYNNRLYSV